MPIKKPEAIEGGKGKLLKLQLNDTKKEFWEAVGQLCRYGVSASDGKGARTELKVYMTQLQKDQTVSLAKHFPTNFFSSQAAMLRFVIAVGCRTIYEYMREIGRMDREMEEYFDVFEKMCVLGMRERKQEFVEMFSKQISSAKRYESNDDMRKETDKLLELFEKFVIK